MPATHTAPNAAPRLLFLAAVFAALLPASPARAEPLEPGYTPGKPMATTPYYGPRSAASQAADLAFIDGMRPHHEGALTMSQEYLSSKAARHPKLLQLARGIIHNQEFEIDMMNRTEQQVKSGVGPTGTAGLSQQKRFFRAPVPGPLDNLNGPHDASARDVQFAKAMIVHHQGALDMAKDYLNNPNAKNPYLRKMSADILFDQDIEIAFMNGIIETYPGNPDDVKIDASMVHGMDHMSHAPKPQKGKNHDHSHH